MAFGPQMGVFFGDTASNSFFTNMLREDYRPGVIEVLNNENFLWDWLPSGAVHVEGKHWVYAKHTGRTAGHAAIGPGGHLPDPDRQRYGRWRGPMRHHYGRIAFDTTSVQASESGVAAFMQTLDAEIRGLVVDMARQQNRMLHSDGSGRLCQVDGNQGPTTDINVELPQVNESPTLMPGMPPTYHLYEGLRLAFMNPANDQIRAVGVVDEVLDDNTVRLTGNVTVTDGDWVVIVSTVDGVTTGATTHTHWTGYKREPMGLEGIFSDANPPAYDGEDAYDAGFSTDSFQNVDRAAAGTAYASANILSSTSLRPAYEVLIQQALTRARKVNGAMIGLMLSSLEAIDAFGSLLLQDRRFMNTMRLSGGWTAVDYAGIPWMGDRDAFPNRIKFIDPSVLQKLELAPYDWEQRDGMFHRAGDYDTFQAWFVGRWNLACTIPDKLTHLTAISEQVTA